MSRGRVAGLLFALLAAGAPGAAAAEWWASAGWIGLKGRDQGAALVEVERRFDEVVWGIFPLVGAFVTSDQAFYPRAGFGRAFPFAEGWEATLTFAAGAYFAGDGDDLGHTVEFRSCLDVGYRPRPNLRFGLALAHLSNASLAEDNPGVETLGLTVAWRP